MKTACITVAKGCTKSRLDATILVDYFRRNGWAITTRFRDADIILVSTCGVTQNIEDQSLNSLSIIQTKKKRSSKLIAFGCLPGINREKIVTSGIMPMTRLEFGTLDSIIGAETPFSSMEQANDLRSYEEYFHEDFTLFNRFLYETKNALAENLFANAYHVRKYKGLLSACKELSRRILKHQPSLKRFADPHDKEVFDIRIATGCMGECTYCALRLVNGPLKSRPLKDILEEIDKGLSKGYQVIRLSTDDAGAYGQDIGSSIIELLSKVLNKGKGFSIMLNDFSPMWLVKYFPDMTKLISAHRGRFDHLVLPLQSGSESMLMRMKRGYTAAEAMDCILFLKKTFPEVHLKTHFMVGFPGETEQDFVDTLKYMRKAPFDEVFIYEYSDRMNTPASEFADKVPDIEKKNRRRRILEECKQRGIVAWGS